MLDFARKFKVTADDNVKHESVWVVRGPLVPVWYKDLVKEYFSNVGTVPGPQERFICEKMSDVV